MVSMGTAALTAVMHMLQLVLFVSLEKKNKLMQFKFEFNSILHTYF